MRGVGEKTARVLVGDYPDIQALVEDASADRRRGALLQRSPALRAAVREAAGYLAAMRQLVPIRTDLEVRAWMHPRDEARVDDVARRYVLRGPIERLTRALGA